MNTYDNYYPATRQISLLSRFTSNEPWPLIKQRSDKLYVTPNPTPLDGRSYLWQSYLPYHPIGQCTRLHVHFDARRTIRCEIRRSCSMATARTHWTGYLHAHYRTHRQVLSCQSRLHQLLNIYLELLPYISLTGTLPFTVAIPECLTTVMVWESLQLRLTPSISPRCIV